MHLAVVDPWGTELFETEYLDQLRDTANESPFDQVWFINIGYAAYPTSQPPDAIREIETDVLGMNIGAEPFVLDGYLHLDDECRMWVLGAADATGPVASPIRKTAECEFIARDPIGDIAHPPALGKGECPVHLG